MKNKLEIYLLDEAADFLRSLPPLVQRRFLSAFDRTTAGFVGNWTLKLTNTADLWEFRVAGPRNTYQLFAFWHTPAGAGTTTLIVATHDLDKKTQKTPPSASERAERLKAHYLSENS